MKARHIESMSQEDAKYHNAQRKIEASSAKYFRLGEALTKEEDNCHEGLDAVDVFFAYARMPYSPIKGRIPGDLPSPEASVQISLTSKSWKKNFLLQTSLSLRCLMLRSMLS